MDEEIRRQVWLIVDQAVSEAETTVDQRMGTIFADHSARGCLRSGATIKIAVGSMGEIGSDLLTSLALRLGALAADDDAVEALAWAIVHYLEICQIHLGQVIHVAGGARSKTENSAATAANDLFTKMSGNLKAKLEIASFDFRHAPKRMMAEGAAIQVTPVPTSSTIRKGGRPPAKFWDDMWAAIATALYSGEFQPKSQADVQRAMLEWIESNGDSAADSSVKSRARRLWDRIAALDV